MKSDHVIRAIEALADGDRERALKLVDAIAQEETAANRMTVARNFQRLKDRIVGGGGMRSLQRLPEGAPSSLRQIPIGPDLDQVMLNEETRRAIQDFVREWNSRQVLRDAGIPTRNTIVLHGPSGNGKTFLASAISSAVGLPGCAVAHGAMVDSHLGVTSGNIEKLTKYLAVSPAVVVFDECDSFLTQRRHGGGPAEMEQTRIVNSLLQMIDANSNSILVFCTNFHESLDSAFLRRAGLVLHMPEPTDAQRAHYADKLPIRRTVPELASDPEFSECLRAGSYAEVEQRLYAIARRIVLNRS